MVGFGGKTPIAASSSCLVTVLGCVSLEKADRCGEGHLGVGDGVAMAGEEVNGGERACERDMLRSKAGLPTRPDASGFVTQQDGNRFGTR